ncbi:MAG: PorT protein [Lutibacter sp.]|nr:MAG: PorT protein [Lutibacter sp.]
MKKIVTLFICLTCIVINKINAQKEVIEYHLDEDAKTIYWGYYLGLNKKDFKINYKDTNTFVEVAPSYGFNVGLIGGWNFHKNLSLRIEPGLSSNTKVLAFTNISGGERDSIRKVGATYLHFPLLLKLQTNRLGNTRPYVIGGVSYDYNFSSNENNPDDNSSGEFRMKSNNFGYEIGLGVDIYLPYFIFSPSIRGTFAINNELVPDNDPNSQWTGQIDYLGTRGVFINLAFH